MEYFISKAYAAGQTDSVVVNKLLNNVLINIINPLIYFLIALAVVYFVYGVMVFIQNADNSEKRDEGFKHIIWGVIGIFIMVSAIGIINIIESTLGL